MALGSMDPFLVTKLQFDPKRTFAAHSFAIAREETSQAFEPTARRRARKSFSMHRATDSLSCQESSRCLLRGNGNDVNFALKKKKKNPALGFGRDGFMFPVRAQAKVERADEQREFETGAEVAENGRKGWLGEQDSRKAKALVESTIYPIMRVYRDDLSSLEVTGDAKASHVIDAMGADGGFTAAEELSKGRSLMTVETIIPGRAEAHTTVSTKLLAPTHLVNKRAKTLWAQNGAPKKASLSSGNALATAFQSVFMQRLLSFDIHVHSPGTVREMANLANEKEDTIMASLESRDATVLDGLAEAICTYSLETIKDNFNQKMYGKRRWYRKVAPWGEPGWVWASNKAIGIRPLHETEIWEHAKRILGEPTVSVQRTRTYQSWWPPLPDFLPSNIIPKEGMNKWSIEFLPIHKIRIDTSKLNAVTKGWQTTNAKGVLELHLSQAQLVDLADVLDLYYEDAYTAPSKTLRSGTELKVSHLSRSKVTKSIWTATLSCVAGGILLVAFLVAVRLKPSTSTGLLLNTSSTSSFSRSDSSFTNKWCLVRTDREPVIPKNDDISAKEMEALCLLVVNRVKDACNLDGQVESSPEKGAWIGPDLTLWGRKQNSVDASSDGSTGDGLLEQRHGEAASQPQNAEDLVSELAAETLTGEPLLLYQVVLSRNGKVLGFQPGNQAAIAHWLEYPFAQELHSVHHLGPGLIERGLRYFGLSEDVVALELLCKGDMHDAMSVAARPLKL